MKATKPMMMAALIAGNLLAGNLTLRAADTNQPPAAPPAAPPPAGPRGPAAAMNFDRLSQQLQLTDDQKPKVKAILDEENQKMRALNTDAGLSMPERRVKRQSIHQETMTRMKEVLTPAQFDQWQRAFGRGVRVGPPPGAPKPGATNAPTAPPKN